MVMVDQRNHGASSEVCGFHPPHSIQASAGDLLSLVRKKLSGRVPDMLVGHSLGGKIVLELLRQLRDSGQQLPKNVFVLDSPLGETNGSIGVHSDTEKVTAYTQALKHRTVLSGKSCRSDALSLTGGWGSQENGWMQAHEQSQQGDCHTKMGVASA